MACVRFAIQRRRRIYSGRHPLDKKLISLQFHAALQISVKQAIAISDRL
jgi:hypothetical protein